MSNSQQVFVIGVDGGGSKTAAVILDRYGHVLGRGRSGSANYHHLGLTAVGENLQAAMRTAAHEAGVDWRQAAAVTWALSGVDRPIDRERMEQLSAEMLPNTPFIIENDAIAALIAGLSVIRPKTAPTITHNGIVQIAGTGTITYGENSQGDRARAGGWGYLCEAGSSYQLALGAFRAVNNALDKIIPPTLLTDLLIAHLELNTITDILTWMYVDGRQVADIARLAPLVTQAAECGDMTAISILQHHADAIAQHVLAVAKQLGLHTQSFQLVYAGSLLIKSDFYRHLVTQAIRTQLPLVRPKIAPHTPVVGAGLLALEKLGLTTHVPQVMEHTIDTFHTTEQRNILSNQLDTLSTLQVVGLMHLQDRQAAASLQPVLPAIAEAIDQIAARMQRGGRLIYVGAGTSGRLGVLDASECPPTFNADPEQVVGVIAGGMGALTRSIENAEDDPAAGADALHRLQLTKNDSVIGISASGGAQFVLAALDLANQSGAYTVALANNVGAISAEHAQHTIIPLVGPELLTGSTRLKSGTAQKLVLNILSTGVMIKLGKTYNNLMVDVQQNNAKLKQRAIRIVAQACEIELAIAADALVQSEGDVKRAIVMVLGGCSLAEARTRLTAAQGRVRAALEHAPIILA